MSADTALQAENEALKKENFKLSRQLTRLRGTMAQNEAVAGAIANVNSVQNVEKKRQENYMRLLLDNNPNIIFLLDKAGNVVYCTKQVLTLAELTSFTSINGKPFRECLLRFMDKEVTDEIESQILQAVNTGQLLEREVSLKISDGSIRRYTLNFILDFSTNKDFGGTAIIMYDITEIREMHEKAVTAQKLAVQASAAKSTFLSNMSHEIRTPINAIIGMTTIAQSAEDCNRKDYCLGKIKEASMQLLAIINDILDMSKIEANKFEISNHTFDLEYFLSRVINIISVKVEEKEQKFSVYVDKRLPEIINTDEQRLSQVLTNLLSNAVKFTPEHGSISLEVKLLAEIDEECEIQFNVIDTGIGLTQEQQLRLFHPFEQADASTSRRFGGTGLGLVISKQIIELMNGTIWVSSQIGHGSDFGFFIRCRRTGFDSTSGIIRVEEKNKPDNDGIFEGKNILVAEDVKINREIVKALLAVTKVDIDFAVNGQEAVSMFTSTPEKYDMIFMDMQMPEMDGIEATSAIRALEIPQAKIVPIVAMTANIFQEDIDKCIAAGMNAHVGKPLNIQVVVGKMKKYIL